MNTNATVRHGATAGTRAVRVWEAKTKDVMHDVDKVCASRSVLL